MVAGLGGTGRSKRVVLAALCVVGACRAKPLQGQVLASVGGRDVTHQDLEAEIRTSGVPDTPANRRTLLRRVIDTRLLADAAHARKLDQTPEAPGDLARLQQPWLAQKFVAGLLKDISPPSPAAVDAYITAHPDAFARRRRYAVSSIAFEASPSLTETLRSYPDLKLAAGLLRRTGVAMQARTGVLDSAKIPPEAAAQLAQAPQHGLIVATADGRITLSEITAHAPVTASGEEQRALARRRLEAREANRRVAAELARLKGTETVAYQSGYAPAPSTVR